MDYKSFLAPKPPLVLPYFGGSRVDAADRRLRVAPGIEPGWWRFEIDGRRAVCKDRASPIDLGALPARHGHWVDGWIVATGRELGRIALPPEDEPPPLARVTARRWYSGDLVLESIDFEDEAELAARRALEDERAIGGLRDVVPSLRAAFGFALGMRVARAAGVPVSLRELAPHVVAIADGGPDAVRAALDALVAERRAAEAAVVAARRAVADAAAERSRVQQVIDHQRTLHTVASAARARARSGTPAERADAALDQAGARMLTCRRVGTSLEVTCEIEGERIIATVDRDTLQVLDAGICLAGADREITLDSLPSVVREAIDHDHLNITRRS